MMPHRIKKIVTASLLAATVGCSGELEMENDLSPEQQLEYAFRLNGMMCEMHRNLIVPKGPAKRVEIQAEGAKVRLICAFDEQGRLTGFGGSDTEKGKGDDVLQFRFTYAEMDEHGHDEGHEDEQEPEAHKGHHHALPAPADATHEMSVISGGHHSDKYYYSGEGQTTLGKFTGKTFASDLHAFTFNDQQQMLSLVSKKAGTTYKQTWQGDSLVAVDQERLGQTVRELTLSGHQYDKHGNLTRYRVMREKTITTPEVEAKVELRWEYR